MQPLARIGLLALGPALGLGIARFAYGLMLPAMKIDLELSYAQAGWLNTINALGYILGATTAATATRRLGAAAAPTGERARNALVQTSKRDGGIESGPHQGIRAGF